MNQKLEDLLNLALETPEEVRRQTDTLNVGFDEASRTWELIVKYHGSLNALEALGVTVEYLIAGYAILTVPDGLVEQMAELEQIEYVEKPKRFFYSAIGPADSACLPFLTMREPFLHGKGVLIAILDSGITYRRRDFRRANGDTRIRYLWDQTLAPTLSSVTQEQYGTEITREQNELTESQEQTDRNVRRPPTGFTMGVEFNEEQINQALRAPTEAEQYAIVPSRDVSGHGTAVAGIAAGYVPEIGYIGVATEADLLIVKLGLPGELGFTGPLRLCGESPMHCKRQMSCRCPWLST